MTTATLNAPTTKKRLSWFDRTSKIRACSDNLNAVAAKLDARLATMQKEREALEKTRLFLDSALKQSGSETKGRGV